MIIHLQHPIMLITPMFTSLSFPLSKPMMSFSFYVEEYTRRPSCMYVYIHTVKCNEDRCTFILDTKNTQKHIVTLNLILLEIRYCQFNENIHRSLLFIVYCVRLDFLNSTMA